MTVATNTKVVDGVNRSDQDYEDMTRAVAAVERGEARAIRKLAGLTVSEIAREIGVTHVAVLYWEGGKRLPRGEHAIRYGRLLRGLSDLPHVARYVRQQEHVRMLQVSDECN